MFNVRSGVCLASATIGLALALAMAMGGMRSLAAQAQPATEARTQTRVGLYEVRANAIETPLVPSGGDPVRGRQVVIDTQRGNCLICHMIADIPEQRFHGDIGPSLAGVGARISEGRLRLRIVDSTRINADSVMPAYFRTSDLRRVAAQWRDKPVLSAGEVEDVVAYLSTLRATSPGISPGLSPRSKQ